MLRTQAIVNTNIVLTNTIAFCSGAGGQTSAIGITRVVSLCAMTSNRSSYFVLLFDVNCPFVSNNACI